MVMDLRIQIQQLDAQLRTAKQENNFLRINCQTLGTALGQMREDVLQVIEQLDNPQVLKEVIQQNLRGALKHDPKEIAQTIVKQGIALDQLRALCAQQQTKLDQFEAAAAANPPPPALES